MGKNPYILRCYGRPEGDHSIGICIDLDIVVQGDGPAEVRRKMIDAITLYFESLDKENLQDLIPRKSPPYVFADYYRVCTIIKFVRFSKSLKEQFQIFCEQIIPEKFIVAPCQ